MKARLEVWILFCEEVLFQSPPHTVKKLAVGVRAHYAANAAVGSPCVS